MAKHSKYSPSGNNPRNLCHAWVPSKGTSANAESGNRCHYSFETGDKSALVSDREREIVAKAEAYVAPLIATADFVEREKRFKINYGDISTTGIADVVIGLGDVLLVGDLKTGDGSLPHAEDDLQTVAYAIGAMDFYPKFQKFRTVLIQPSRDELTVANWTREQLEEKRRYLNELHLACDVPDPEMNPSSACKFCGAKPNCPALVTTAMKVGKNLGLSIPDELDPKNLPSEWFDEVGLPLIEILEPWCKAAKQHCVEKAKAGHEFENYELRERNASRRIEDMKCAINAARAAGLTDDEILQNASMSVPKTEKAIATKNGSDGLDTFKLIVGACMHEPGDPISFLAKKPKRDNKPIDK